MEWNHRSVTARSARLDGSIQLEQRRAANLRSNRVNGDIQLFSNRAAQDVTGNTVDGNLDPRPAPRTSRWPPAGSR